MDEPANRTAFFVDGFNLYHSVCEAEKATDQRPLKWLDIPAMCESTLHLIGKTARFAGVHYFSAYADHLSEQAPHKVQRHKIYVRALTATRRVKVHLGHFRKRDTFISELNCYKRIHEEKETDVAIACTALRAAFLDEIDTAVLLTGDSDLAPAVRTYRELYPQKRILFAFPYHRKSKELAKLCPNSFSLSLRAYLDHQLPERVRLPSNKDVVMPLSWGNQPPA